MTLSIRIRHVLTAVLALLCVVGALWSPTSAAQEGDERTIKIQVRDQFEDPTTGRRSNEPVPDVAVQVFDGDGTLIGEGTTDDAGVVLVPVPGPATYQVILDESTLPDGTSLSAQTPADRQVNEDQFRSATFTVNYFTGERVREGAGFFSKLAQRSIDGARLGLILAMCSVGLSLLFGTTGLTNFAHGELVTFGAMAAFVLNVTWDLMSLWFAAPLALLIGGMFGLLLDFVIFAPLRRKGVGLISQLVVTVGLSIILRNVFLKQFGGSSRQYRDFNQQTNLKWGPVGITPRDLTTALISLGVLIAVALVLQRSRLGKATRAVSDNPELASTTGIDSQKIIRIVWFLGAMLATMGGIFRGLDEGIKPDMGLELLFLMFAGITLGGLGSPFGALIGGFLIGLTVETSTLFGVSSELKKVPAMLILVVILLVRPQGILGRRERVG